MNEIAAVHARVLSSSRERVTESAQLAQYTQAIEQKYPQQRDGSDEGSGEANHRDAQRASWRVMSNCIEGHGQTKVGHQYLPLRLRTVLATPG